MFWDILPLLDSLTVESDMKHGERERGRSRMKSPKPNSNQRCCGYMVCALACWAVMAFMGIFFLYLSVDVGDHISMLNAIMQGSEHGDHLAVEVKVC